MNTHRRALAECPLDTHCEEALVAKGVQVCVCGVVDLNGEHLSARPCSNPVPSSCYYVSKFLNHNSSLKIGIIPPHRITGGTSWLMCIKGLPGK